MAKKPKNQKKIEFSEADKTKLHKGELNRMQKIIQNLENRIFILEKKLENIKISTDNVLDKGFRDSEGHIDKQAFVKKFKSQLKDKNNG